MPCTIVVGGQYGSEGKGKVVALTASLLDEPWVVRCGGPNSGHTTNVNGEEVVLRQLPAAAGHPNAMLFISAGCAVSEEILLHELDMCRLPAERVVVDPRAVLVTKDDIEAEQELAESIGSTASGTGSALARRMLRHKDVRLAADSELLRSQTTITAVAPMLHDVLDRGGDVVIEGTQGFGLSLLHGFKYPFVTARDTTASAFASEVGLSPLQISSVVMVIRTFPIRVGGNSGDLASEISWERVRELSGAPEPLPEYTSVTKRLRRVAAFDFELVKAASQYNRPTAIALMGCDRLDHANLGARTVDDLSESTKRFVSSLWRTMCVPIPWLGTGFRTFDAISVDEAVLLSGI